MVIGIIARQIGRHLYRALRVQDDILDEVLHTAPARNMLGRASIRGIRHGIAAGTLASPLIEQSKSRRNGFQKRQPFTPYKQRKNGQRGQQYPRSRNKYYSPQYYRYNRYVYPQRHKRCTCRKYY